MKKIPVFLVAGLLMWPAFAATKSATLAVKGWTCGSCAVSTRIALKKLEGIADVKTDMDRQEAAVTYEDSKVTPESMIQAIEKLGYSATLNGGESADAATIPIHSQKSGPSALPTATLSPERVSFFQVPLGCCAADGLGCGSLAKPILKDLAANPRIADAKIDYPGTTLAVSWKDPRQIQTNAAIVEASFEKRGLEAKALRGGERNKALKDYETGRWYGAADVDRLSEREAQVIAARIVHRAQDKLGLAPDRLAALTQDMSVVIAQTLTSESEKQRQELGKELTKVADRHLDSTQAAELQKAAEQGVLALPGEAK